jgi:tetratricopeptide (TPR) repeat protein
MSMPRIRLLLLVVLAAVLTACASPEEKAANYVKSAQALFDQGDVKKAGIEARNALQIQPKNAAARFILARVAGKDGNYKEMYGNLLIAVESDPGLIAARLDLGTLLALSGNPADAARQADAVAALAPDDPGLHVLRARLLIAARDGPGARQELDRALAQQPALRDAVILKAGLIADLDPDAALNTLDAAIASGGKADNMAFRTMRASILQANKRLVEPGPPG